MKVYKVTAPGYENEANTLHEAKEICREYRAATSCDSEIMEYEIDLHQPLAIASFTGKFRIIKSHALELA